MFSKANIKSLCVTMTVMIAVAAVIVIVISVIFVGIIIADNENFGIINELVGGKVAVKIESSDFDSNKVARSDFSIANASGLSTGIVLFYGDCDDLGKNITILPEKKSIIDLESSYPQGMNYYDDTPLYALAGTSLTYNVSVSVNSRSVNEQIYITLYLFNSPVSYQNFINGYGFNFTYYRKSDFTEKHAYICSTAVAVSWTISFNESVFVFGGITVANVTSIANVTISGQRYEYDASSLDKKTLYNSSTIEFCDSSPCFGLYGKKHCVLAKSDILTTLTYQNENVDFEAYRFTKLLIPYATVIILALILLFVVLAIICCMYKIKTQKKERRTEGETRDATIQAGAESSNVEQYNSNSSVQEVNEGRNTTSQLYTGPPKPLTIPEHDQKEENEPVHGSQACKPTLPNGQPAIRSPRSPINEKSQGKSRKIHGNAEGEKTDTDSEHVTDLKSDKEDELVHGKKNGPKPTVNDMDTELADLVEWTGFALKLPEMDQTEISIIKNDHPVIRERKRALYNKWLRAYTQASWDDVVKALEGEKENVIAERIRKKYLA